MGSIYNNSCVAEVCSSTETQRDNIIQLFPRKSVVREEKVTVTPKPIVVTEDTDLSPTTYGFKNSPLTSRGRPKAQPACAVKSKEEIDMISNYFLTHGDVEWIRNRNYMMWCLGITLGLRISDLLSLRICDVLEPNGEFKKYITVYEQKTGKRRKSLLSTKGQECIRQYINSIYKNIEGKTYYDYLFKSNRGKLLTTESAHRIMKQMSKDLELPYNVGTHTLRKTFAYWTIKLNSDNGEVMGTLQQLLNHSDQRVTFRYAGIEEDTLMDIYEGISNTLL